MEKDGGTSYTFVTEGLAAAVEQARDAAGGKDVLIAGGVGLAQQALAADWVASAPMVVLMPAASAN